MPTDGCGLTVLYEDPHLLALDKPAGTTSQGPAPAGASLEDQVRAYLGPGPAFVGVVHRLDRPTSGVILWAKTVKAARRLSAQFGRREVVKRYWAVVDGVVEPRTGRWEDWLGPILPASVVSVSVEGAPQSRRAITDYEVLGIARLPAGQSLLSLEPETGRTHQLRVQASSCGLPILGDSAYGSTVAFPLGIALHARSLEVRHPISGEPLRLVAGLPTSWAEAGIAPTTIDA